MLSRTLYGIIYPLLLSFQTLYKSHYRCAKKSKQKTEPKNKKKGTKKPVNRTKFQKISVWLTEPEKYFSFQFGYGLGGLKIRLIGS